MKNYKIGIFTALMMISIPQTNAQKSEGVAQTPPMGWNSWNKFACDINEDLNKEIAGAIVESGLKDVGYIFINVIDCWLGEIDWLAVMHSTDDKFI